MQPAGPGRGQLGLGGQACPWAIRRTALPTGSELRLSPLAEGTQQKITDILSYLPNTVTMSTRQTCKKS